jgi:hypothetical protein
VKVFTVYKEVISCEVCGKCIGWAPIMHEAYQCDECNRRLAGDEELVITYTREV